MSEHHCTLTHRLACGHCPHDLCADCDRCCSCKCSVPVDE